MLYMYVLYMFVLYMFVLCMFVLYMFVLYMFVLYMYMPICLRCPRLLHQTLVGKSTCGGSEVLPLEARPKDGNYDGV